MTTSTNALLLAFSEEYADPGCVALKTAIMFGPAELEVVVGSVDLSDRTLRRLGALVEGTSHGLTVVDARPAVSMFPVVGRYPPITWSSAVAAELLGESVGRALFLDADVLVRSTLVPLFEASLRGRSTAAVPDQEMPSHRERGPEFVEAAGIGPDAPYFNSGVLVIDVQRWRRKGVALRARTLVREGSISFDFVDQDALNLVLGRDWIGLDAHWNLSARSGAGVDDPAIVQFVGTDKPWHEGYGGRFADEYRSVLEQVRAT